MVKDEEDWLGLQTTAILKNLGQTFQTVQPWLCSFKNGFSPAARLIFRIRKKFGNHFVRIVLFHLYWLPLAYRVYFMLLLLVYKSLNNQGPKYTFYMPTLLQLVVLVPATFKSQKLIYTRPLVITPLPILSRVCPFPSPPFPFLSVLSVREDMPARAMSLIF